MVPHRSEKKFDESMNKLNAWGEQMFLLRLTSHPTKNYGYPNAISDNTPRPYQEN